MRRTCRSPNVVPGDQAVRGTHATAQASAGFFATHANFPRAGVVVAATIDDPDLIRVPDLSIAWGCTEYLTPLRVRQLSFINGCNCTEHLRSCRRSRGRARTRTRL